MPTGTDFGSYSWPGNVSSNPSVGTNGSTAPTSSTEIGGVGPDGNLHPISVSNTGVVNVALTGITPSPLPVTDAAAEASLASIDTKSTSIVTNTGNTATNTSNTATSVASIDTKTPALGQAVMTASVPVVIASNQSAVAVSASSLPLPTGAATAANQTNGGQKSQVVNSAGTSVDAKALNVQVVSTDVGLVTNSVLHGLNSGGGGTYVDVKVTPSGALVVDGTDSTQPVSGTVTANQGAANTIANAWPSKITDGTNTTSVTASSALKVDGSAVTQPISAASLPLPTGASTETTLAKLALAQGSTTSGQSGTLILGAVTTSAPTYTTAQSSPLSLDTTGALRVNASITSTVVTASSSSITSAASSASSVSLLASNASRKGATFFNDSTSVLYLKMGATASTTSYTVQIPSNGYYEIPTTAVYTGAIDGIWSSANGNARITELS